MTGVVNRIPNVICEVGTCTWSATHSEYITVVRWNGDRVRERCEMDIALCQRHDAQFQRDGLVGTVTAYGDQIMEQSA